MRQMLVHGGAALATALFAGAAVAQSAGQPSLPNAPVVETAPAPAFKAGDPVVDAQGMAVGAIKTLTEADTGPVVVIEIDGKLVGVPQSTLKMAGTRVVSSQTKAQMLAAAGAPR